MCLASRPLPNVTDPCLISRPSSTFLHAACCPSQAEPPSNDSSLADTVESRGSLKADNTCDCLSEGNGVGNAMGVQGASAAEELAGGGSKPFAKDTGVKQTEGNMVKVCLNVEDDKVTMKAEVKEAEMMNSEVKAMGKGIAEEKKKQAEVRKDDTAWLPDAEEEVLSALGRAVRDFNTRIPPEPLDSEAWKKFATTVSQRLRQLLQVKRLSILPALSPFPPNPPPCPSSISSVAAPPSLP